MQYCYNQKYIFLSYLTSVAYPYLMSPISYQIREDAGDTDTEYRIVPTSLH